MRIVVWTTVFERPVVDALSPIVGIEVSTPQTREAFLADAAQADGVVMMGGFQSYAPDVAEILRGNANLKWLQLISAGYEGVEANGAPEQATLTGPGEGVSSAVAEHAMALLWALARGVAPAAAQQAQGRWDRAFATRMTMLSGKTLLMLGLGDIGRKTSRLAKALGMRVIGVSHSGRPVEGPDEVRPVSELDALLPQTDAIVLALPLKESTRHILDAAALARCKPEAFIVNVGRGELIEQDALIAALNQGRLAGAGLDVMEPEPLPEGHALWSTPNVILTPHVGGAGDREGAKRIAGAIAENARRLIAGEPLINPVVISRT